MENTIQSLHTEVDSFNADSVKTDKFIQLVKKYMDFTELTTPMLNEFVEKVVVHEADKSTGERVQKVDIYFNFIRQFGIDSPDDELSPDQKGQLTAKPGCCSLSSGYVPVLLCGIVMIYSSSNAPVYS